MGYYMRGDYYRGDYYRGDPGFFGGLVGGIVGAAKGFVTGGIGGAISGAVAGANTGSRSPGSSGPPAPPSQGFGGFSFPAGGGIATPFGGIGTLNTPPGTRPPAGYHIIKKGPHAGKLTKNRHMNVTNPRALSRAARRAHGFLKMSRRFVRYYQPHARKGHAYIGRKRGRSR